MNSRDLIVVAITLTIGAIISAAAALIYLPNTEAIPIVVMIGSMGSTLLAPIITNIIVTKIVTPIKSGQSALADSQQRLHKKVDRIEHDVNSTATKMAEELGAIRRRNTGLEIEAQQRKDADDAGRG